MKLILLLSSMIETICPRIKNNLSRPIVNPIWFYLAGLFGEVNLFAWIFAFVSGVGAVLCLISASEEFDEERAFFYKIFKRFVIATIVFTIIAAAVPSSNTVQEMAVASVVTYENVEAAKGEATELIDYIIDSVDKLNDSKEYE